MLRIRTFATLFVLFAAGTAQATGLNLRWNACYGDGGAANRTSACTTTLGTAGAMVGSFVLGTNHNGVNGIEFIFDVATETATLPAWWTFNAPGGTVGCRANALSVNSVVSGAAISCVDWAAGQGAGGLISYTVGFSGPNTARFKGGFALAQPVTLVANTEYFGINVVLTNAKSTGTGSCAGCTVPACIAVNQLTVYHFDSPDNTVITGPANGAGSNYVSWQGGGSAAGLCALGDSTGFSVTTAVSGRGTIARSRDKTTYPTGSPLTLTALPLAGDRFVSWSGDATSANPILPIIVDRPLSFFATFERDPAAAAVVSAVADVPNDQGSSVRVNWNRSPLDDAGNAGLLCCYRIDRTLNASPGSPWVAASGPILPVQSPSYSQVVITPADSTGVDPALLRYRVVLTAAGGSADWISNEVTGYSVDNLAPTAPSSISGVIASGVATMFWPAVTASDLAHYSIYRATDGVPPLDAAHRVGTTGSTNFTDSPGFFANYRVTAVDTHGNESPATLFVPLNTTDASGRPTPRTLSVGNPTPSPMARSMSMALGLPHAMNIAVDVLDSQGRVVRRLAEGERPAGWFTLSWDARDARGRGTAAGVYFVRVQTPEGRSVKRLVLIP